MQLEQENPTFNSYWVTPGKLLAGVHPGSTYSVRTRQTLRQLLEADVTVFIDLTEEGEYYAYERLLEQESITLRRLIAYYQMPIRDESIPSVEGMVSILDIIDNAIKADRAVYVHCQAGRGRTGTVIGCYLARHGMSGEAALRVIAELRRGMLFDGNLKSPQHLAQIQMVLNWSVGR